MKLLNLIKVRDGSSSILIGQPRPLFAYFRSFQTILNRNNCRLQRDSNSDRRSIGVEGEHTLSTRSPPRTNGSDQLHEMEYCFRLSLATNFHQVWASWTMLTMLLHRRRPRLKLTPFNKLQIAKKWGKKCFR